MAKEQFKRQKPHVTLEPTPPPPPPPNGMVLDTSSGALESIYFTFTTTDQSDGYYAIYATPFLPTGISKPGKGMFRLLAAIQNLGLAGTLDFTDAYADKFPNSEAGGVVFVRMVYINSLSGQSWNLGQWKAVAEDV